MKAHRNPMAILRDIASAKAADIKPEIKSAIIAELEKELDQIYNQRELDLGHPKPVQAHADTNGIPPAQEAGRKAK